MMWRVHVPTTSETWIAEFRCTRKRLNFQRASHFIGISNFTISWIRCKAFHPLTSEPRNGPQGLTLPIDEDTPPVILVVTYLWRRFLPLVILPGFQDSHSQSVVFFVSWHPKCRNPETLTQFLSQLTNLGLSFHYAQILVIRTLELSKWSDGLCEAR